MGANQSTPLSSTTTNSSNGWACCTGRAGKGAAAAATSTTGTPPTSTSIVSVDGIPPELLQFKEAAPLPDPIVGNNSNITTARSLISRSEGNLFDECNDDLLVSPVAYPVTVTLRMRRARPGTDHTNVAPLIRVHIVINDIQPSNKSSTTATTAKNNNISVNRVNGSNSNSNGNSSSNEVVRVEENEKKASSIHDVVQISVSPPPPPQLLAVELQSERRKLAEAGAALLLSYLTQTWSNQKVLDGWVETSWQALPAPNQSDTKFRVECVLPASPREVVDAMSTWLPSTNRIQWDAAMQSYSEVEIIDDNTRVIAAYTKPVNAGFASVESREFIDLSLCRQLTLDERKTIIDSRPSTADPIPDGEWWISTVRADDSLSSRSVAPTCVRAINYPNGVVIYPAANGASRMMLVVYNELQLGWKKSFLRSTMPSELKTMMTRLRGHLQVRSPSPSLPPLASSPSSSSLSPISYPSTPSLPSPNAASASSPVAVSSTGQVTITPSSSNKA